MSVIQPYQFNISEYFLSNGIYFNDTISDDASSDDDAPLNITLSNDAIDIKNNACHCYSKYLLSEYNQYKNMSIDDIMNMDNKGLAVIIANVVHNKDIDCYIYEYMNFIKNICHYFENGMNCSFLDFLCKCANNMNVEHLIYYFLEKKIKLCIHGNSIHNPSVTKLSCFLSE